MTDHKFTDDEIIKALECCLNGNVYKSAVEICSPCPFFHDGNCTDLLKQNALALINRQKAEIESLQTVHADMTESLRLAAEANKDMQAEIESLKDGWDYIPANAARALKEHAVAEAIKEFAERLVAIYENDKTYDRPNAHTLVVTVFRNIDTLVKEMTETK